MWTSSRISRGAIALALTGGGACAITVGSTAHSAYAAAPRANVSDNGVYTTVSLARADCDSKGFSDTLTAQVIVNDPTLIGTSAQYSATPTAGVNSQEFDGTITKIAAGINTVTLTNPAGYEAQPGDQNGIPTELVYDNGTNFDTGTADLPATCPTTTGPTTSPTSTPTTTSPTTSSTPPVGPTDTSSSTPPVSSTTTSAAPTTSGSSSSTPTSGPTTSSTTPVNTGSPTSSVAPTSSSSSSTSKSPVTTMTKSSSASAPVVKSSSNGSGELAGGFGQSYTSTKQYYVFGGVLLMIVGLLVFVQPKLTGGTRRH